MAGVLRKKHTFFSRSKTTAHNIDITVRKKFPIACRTIGNTTALKRGLAVKSDTARMGTRGKKNSKTLEITPIRMNSLYHTGSFKTGHFGKDNLRAKGFGLSANGFCQGHSRNGGNARIIDDPLRNGNLPAKFFLFKDQDAIAGPCQIKGCRETSRAAANNKNII